MAEHAHHSPSSFEMLPVEIIAHILKDHTLDDIRNVRLLCRVMARASGGRFKLFCATKEVDVRSQALQEMCALLNPGSVACELTHLTLTSVVYVTLTQERIIRSKTKPADSTDIFGHRRDAIGNCIAKRPARVPASDEDLALAQAELEVLKRWQNSAALERSNGNDVKDLAEPFKRIRQHTILGKLQSMTLNVAVMRCTKQRRAPEHGGALTPVWDAAAHTFLVTLQALANAGLVVERLNVYSGLRACSVPVFDIASALQHFTRGEYISEALDRVLGTIRALSLSTTARSQAASREEQKSELDVDDAKRDLLLIPLRFRRTITPNPDIVVNAEEILALRDDTRNFTGVASLLQKMPDLEELMLQDCYLHYLEYEEWKVFHTIANSCNLRRLKKLTLSGLQILSKDLLLMLQENSYLESAVFRNVELLHGRWQSIFDHLSDPTYKLKLLCLDALFECPAERTVYVSFPGGLHGPYIPADRSGPYTGVTGKLRVEDRESVLAGIDYRVIEHWIVGCVEYTMWAVERSREYSPPRTRA